MSLLPYLACGGLMGVRAPRENTRTVRLKTAPCPAEGADR
jgi:hypothetical protein